MKAAGGNRWDDADRLFDQALDLPADERDRWLDRACAGDPELRAQVNALLHADAAAAQFLEVDALRLSEIGPEASVQHLPADRQSLESRDRLQSAIGSRYGIAREIGHGGMAVVYEAHDLRYDRTVALKVFQPQLSEWLGTERFLREIRLLARLHHPHLLPLYDSGELDGLLFYVTPYVKGGSLENLLRREGRLPLGRGLELAREVADVLDYAHRQQVVHRDIKPGNILLDEGHAVVADFGIATALSAAADTALTQPGILIGTPAYMSPEQATDGPVDGRSDIYALGSVLYAMIAGHPPFTATSPMALLALRLTEPAPSLADAGANVPAEVEDLVARALAQRREDRFQTAGELALALAAAERRLALGQGSGLPAPRTPQFAAIGVLPFVNMSDDPDNEYFSDGMTEELIHALSQVRGLRVPARTSAFTFKGQDVDVREMGRRLDVGAVLEGSVRRAGDRVRVTAQLINASDGYHLWSATYDRKLADVFALQEELAQAIIGALPLPAGATPAPLVRPSGSGADVRAASRPPPPSAPRRDPVAHESYLRGRYHWNKRTDEEITRAVVWFERAIARAPGDAVCHAALADAHLTLAIYGAAAPEHALVKARAAAEQALALDPKSAEAHAALGSVSALYEWSGRRAEEHFRLAVELEPGYATAHQWRGMHLLVPLGRFSEARRALEVAHEFDPLSPAILASAAVVSMFEREWDRALRELLEVIDLEPGFAAAHYFLGQVHLGRGEGPEAQAEFTQAVSLARRSTETLAGLAYAQAVGGQPHEAVAVLDELMRRAEQTYVSPVRIAQIHLGLGNRAEALAWLERGVDRRATEVVWFGVHPIFDELRSEPAFHVLLDRADLAPRQPVADLMP